MCWLSRGSAGGKRTDLNREGLSPASVPCTSLLWLGDQPPQREAASVAGEVSGAFALLTVA